MTEAEWLACAEPDPMLDHVEETATARKLRLFIFGACQRIRLLLVSSSSRVVDLVERVADHDDTSGELGLAAAEARNYIEMPASRLTESGCSAAHAAAYATEDYLGERLIWVAYRSAECVRNSCYWAAREISEASGEVVEVGLEAAGLVAERAEAAFQSALLRDIFGNPFRPVTLDADWLTSTVVALARGIYEERAFDRLPILADALQDAGCDSDDLLAHLRGPGPHVRGCWALDLVLGKE